ncbi:7378_t:CDS:2 [Paraglomus occultum]|uniref:7378_t:CDS:1 n=1 Tax=Paraglomus occultum TaxID=144539 RepID=A0A9N9CFN2_9GLOM|nr:7378_t:CDS:2 [Paraglomus occultum]
MDEASDMGEELQKYFDNLIARIDRLKAITMTDRDGVVLIQASTSGTPPKVLEPMLSTTFAAVSDQASRLGLKRNKSLVSFFELYQVVQFNHSPLITTLVADADSNTGILLSLGDELKEIAQLVATVTHER